MVLRQCFETLRENQAQGTSKVKHHFFFNKEKKTKFSHYIDGTLS
jgi:hypothetical protein